MSIPPSSNPEHRPEAFAAPSPDTQSEAAGRFAGVIAHDVNNLLQGIVGSIELVRNFIRMGKGEQADRFLDAATLSAKRIARMTERLHAFSGRGNPALSSIDVNAVVSSVAGKTLGEVKPTVRLDLELSESLWPILGDAALLEKAITELIFNSSDALPDGGTISVATRNVQAGVPGADGPGSTRGNFVCIRIADSGEGMTAEVMKKAFDPLFTTRAAGLAKGLGLPIVKVVVDQMHGFVRFSSEVRRGTSVDLYLPAHPG